MQQFNSYYQPNLQMLNNQEMQLQRQISNLQTQLQQAQALQSQVAQLQQTANMQPVASYPQNNSNVGVSTRIVEDFTNISVDSVPMDSNGAFFVKRDGSEIQLKRWNGNGQIVTTPYLPVLEGDIENSTLKEEKAEFTLLEDATSVLLKRFDELSGRLDGIENVLLNNKTTKSTGRPKKEVVDNVDEQ